MVSLNPRTKNLTGQRFGNLTVIQAVGYVRKRVIWECICDCGKTTTAKGSTLLNGTRISCGCLEHITNGSNKKYGCPTCGYVCSGKGPYNRHVRLCPKTIEDLCKRMKTTIDATTDCWLTKAKQCVITYAGKKTRGYVVAYQLAHGDIAPGNVVCHSCDVRNCINPAHLWQGTQQENIADMWHKGRGKLAGFMLDRL